MRLQTKGALSVEQSNVTSPSPLTSPLPESIAAGTVQDSVAEDTVLSTQYTTNKNLQWKGEGNRINEHLGTLRKIRQDTARRAKLAKEMQERRARFNQLPKEDTVIYTEAFKHFVVDPFLMKLEPTKVRECLIQAGLGGRDIDEQLAAIGICRSCGNVDVVSFGIKVVPSVRRAFTRLRQPRVEDAFNSKPSRCGVINLDGCVEIVCEIVGRFVDRHLVAKQADLIQRESSAAGSQHVKIQREDSLQEVRATNSSHGSEAGSSPRKHSVLGLLGGAFQAARKTQQANETPVAQAHDVVQGPFFSLSEVVRLTDFCCQATERDRYLQEQRILEIESLTDPAFAVMRADWPLLHDLFLDYTHTGANHPHRIEGRVMQVDCFKLLRDFGLPRKLPKFGVIDDHGISFQELLHELEVLRMNLGVVVHHDLERSFRNFMRHRAQYSSGNDASSDQAADEVPSQQLALYVKEVPTFVDTSMLGPLSPEERDALMSALEDWLSYDSKAHGLMDFPSLCRVFQRMKEHVARMVHQREVDTVVEAGLSDTDLEELHYAFDAIDEDHSGTLDMDEVFSAVERFGYIMSKSVFKAAYKKFDNDGSDGLDFSEFVKFLGHIKSSSEAMQSNRPLATLEDLTHAEATHMVGYFKFVPDGDDVPLEQLLALLCKYTKIEKDVPLKSRCNIRTFHDLCRVVSRMVEGS